MVPNMDISMCRILSKMLHRWLFLSIVGIACHLASGEPQEILDNGEFIESDVIPFPYYGYWSIAGLNGNENLNEISSAHRENEDQPYIEVDGPNSTELERKKRSAEPSKDSISRNKRWTPVFQDDSVQSKYYPLVWSPPNNSEGALKEKRSFSPWGGKRGHTLTNQVWSPERGFLRESSMPKRVRFSPWGGKRSGNFKPTPEKIYNLRSGNVDNKDPRAKIVRAYAAFVNDFKPSRQYNDLYLKEDGKRKVKFSSWGGKRSSPIIESIQSPGPHTVKEFLDSILLITGPHSNRAGAATN